VKQDDQVSDQALVPNLVSITLIIIYLVLFYSSSYRRNFAANFTVLRLDWDRLQGWSYLQLLQFINHKNI
jgi:hypothetical protein